MLSFNITLSRRSVGQRHSQFLIIHDLSQKSMRMLLTNIRSDCRFRYVGQYGVRFSRLPAQSTISPSPRRAASDRGDISIPPGVPKPWDGLAVAFSPRRQAAIPKKSDHDHEKPFHNRPLSQYSSSRIRCSMIDLTSRAALYEIYTSAPVKDDQKKYHRRGESLFDGNCTSSIMQTISTAPI